MRASRIWSVIFASGLALLLCMALSAWAKDKEHKCKKIEVQLPATGQTTAYPADTLTTQGATVPDDGTVRAGAPLRYTDNGNGTITDNNTGLMWEKKSWETDDGNWFLENGLLKDNLLHIVAGWSRWSYLGQATIWDWLAQINAEGGTGFAGYNDWRIPNVRELQSLVDWEGSDPPRPKGGASSAVAQKSSG